MAIRAVCPKCHARLNVPSKMASQTIHCPKCGSLIGIDGPEPLEALPVPVDSPPPVRLPAKPFDFQEPSQPVYQQPPTINQTVVFQSDYGRPPDFPHAVHAAVTVLTCGLWAPGWLVFYLLYPHNRGPRY